MSLLNEFMCGPRDIQDIKGKTDVEADHDTGSLPDRLINPDEYEPVQTIQRRKTKSWSMNLEG